MASNSFNQLETVSGITPFHEKVIYQLSTGQVKDFIQKDFEEVDKALVAKNKIRPDQATRVRVLTLVPDMKSDEAGARAKEKLERKKWQMEHAENDHQAKQLALEYSRMLKEYVDAKYLNFYPFILILSSNVLKCDMKKKNRSSIFDINPDKEKIDLKDFYYELIKRYVFSNKEAASFGQKDWMRSIGIKDLRCGEDLLTVSKPRIIGVNGRPIKMHDFDPYEHMDANVFFLIDPRRVFIQMLLPKNRKPHQWFDVVITEVEQLTPKNYRYTVERKLLSGSPKNKDDDRIYAQIRGMISGA